MVRVKTDKNSNNYSTRSCLARSMDKNWESRSEERKTGMGNRKAKTRECQKSDEQPKLENARTLKGIYSIDLEDEEYKRHY